MMKRGDAIGVGFTGVVLVTVLVSGLSSTSILLATAIFIISLINLAPQISDERQKYAIIGLAIPVMLGTALFFVGDPVVVTLVIGAVIGLTAVLTNGTGVRWPAIGVFSLAILISTGMAVLSGRLVTALVLVATNVIGLASARYYWQAQ